MNPDQVRKLNEITGELGKLITEVKPTNDGEWEALEKMATAHKGLRSINRSPLGQQTLI